MTLEVGKFKLVGEEIEGPADYMLAQGNARLDEILAGNNVVFNSTSYLSPSLEVAVLVHLQTDYAGWIGFKSFADAHGI